MGSLCARGIPGRSHRSRRWSGRRACAHAGPRRRHEVRYRRIARFGYRHIIRSRRCLRARRILEHPHRHVLGDCHDTWRDCRRVSCRPRKHARAGHRLWPDAPSGGISIVQRHGRPRPTHAVGLSGHAPAHGRLVPGRRQARKLRSAQCSWWLRHDVWRGSAVGPAGDWFRRGESDRHGPHHAHSLQHP